MSTFPFAMVVSQTALSEQYGALCNGETFEYASALPNAPVVGNEVPVRPPGCAEPAQPRRGAAPGRRGGRSGPACRSHAAR